MATKTAWDFVEKFYPNYDSSQDIARANDLEKIINGECQPDDCATDLLNDEFGGDTENPEIMNEYNKIHRNIYQEAIEEFINNGLL